MWWRSNPQRTRQKQRPCQMAAWAAWSFERDNLNVSPRKPVWTRAYKATKTQKKREKIWVWFSSLLPHQHSGPTHTFLPPSTSSAQEVAPVWVGGLLVLVPLVAFSVVQRLECGHSWPADSSDWESKGLCRDQQLGGSCRWRNPGSVPSSHW